MGDGGEISIHALREEGDANGNTIYDGVEVFLSTPSARRATDGDHLAAVIVAISIHALREEGDPHRPELALTIGDFYPRPPRGGRPDYLGLPTKVEDFYPRPPRGGRHYHEWYGRIKDAISIHALREEGD